MELQRAKTNQENPTKNQYVEKSPHQETILQVVTMRLKAGKSIWRICSTLLQNAICVHHNLQDITLYIAYMQHMCSIVQENKS